jgi:hypothetical protein
MDRGPKEREQAKKINHAIRLSFKKRRRQRKKEPPPASGASVIPSSDAPQDLHSTTEDFHSTSAPCEHSYEYEGATSVVGVTDQSGYPLPNHLKPTTALNGLGGPRTLEPTPEPLSAQFCFDAFGEANSKSPISISHIPDKETNLMYYLDNVFPIQFPFYNFTTPYDGRGWLLDILLRFDSFRRASCTLSAFHQLSALPVKTEEKTHHEITIDLQNYQVSAAAKLTRLADRLIHGNGVVYCQRRLEILVQSN